MTLELDPANTRIEFTLGATLHTVHGTFALKSGTIHFDPLTAAVSGLIVVDAETGNSDNKSRDRKMQQEVLESQRYPEITFTPAKILGRVELKGNSASVQVEGVFRLHGSDHPMSVTLPVQMRGNTLSVRTHLVVPYVAWGLKNPSTFLLHVSDTVDIDVTAVGRMAEQEAPPQSH
jgi:polyisoprenoid-binding protein YceI